MTLMPIVRRFRWTTFFQVVALTGALLAFLDGRHPPAHAQSMSDVILSAQANQQRDDRILDLQAQLNANRASLDKLWTAVNDIRAAQQKAEVDAAARTNTSTYLNGSSILGLLVSIALQLKGQKTKGKRSYSFNKGDQEDN